MSRSISRLLLSFTCLVLVSVSGCSETVTIGKVTLWPLGGPISDTVAGVTPPAERIRSLQQMAENGASTPAEQQQRISAELAAEYQKEADPLIRLEIVRTLSHFQTESAAATLRTAASDADRDVRVAACEAWGKRRGPEATSILANVLDRDSDIDVRLAAAKALGDTGDTAAVAALGGALEDSDPALQVRAVSSLREVTGKDFGGDVDRWRLYVKGETPGPPRPVSLADRLRGLFW